MHITMVKKIKADGSPCNKCADVERRLHAAGLQDRIDSVAIADERDPLSEGMQLAHKHRVERAPFFIVEDDTGKTKIYTIYFQLLKEVLGVGPR
jgi:hypothetical protein